MRWEHRRTRVPQPLVYSMAQGGTQRDWVEKQAPSLFCGGAGSLHAKLLLSLGPWPALKESRVLKMVRREKDGGTAQATIKFQRAHAGCGCGL